MNLDAIHIFLSENIDSNDSNWSGNRGQQIDPKVLLEELAYSISHDFNTPLRQIRSYLNLLEMELEKQNLGQETKELICRVMESSEKLQKQHQALLRYSRIGRAELSLKSFSLDEMVLDVFHAFEGVYPINLEAVLSKVSIESDPNLVKEILEELFQNAIKFSKDGEIPRIELSLYGERKNIILEVRDHGIGFTSGHRDKIFALFQSLHSPITHPSVGVGAGLALCLRMAERIGVQIIPHGEENEGTCFTLIFPSTV